MPNLILPWSLGEAGVPGPLCAQVSPPPPLGGLPVLRRLLGCVVTRRLTGGDGGELGKLKELSDHQSGYGKCWCCRRRLGCIDRPFGHRQTKWAEDTEDGRGGWADGGRRGGVVRWTVETDVLACECNVHALRQAAPNRGISMGRGVPRRDRGNGQGSREGSDGKPRETQHDTTCWVGKGTKEGQGNRGGCDEGIPGRE